LQLSRGSSQHSPGPLAGYGEEAKGKGKMEGRRRMEEEGKRKGKGREERELEMVPPLFGLK